MTFIPHGKLSVGVRNTQTHLLWRGSSGGEGMSSGNKRAVELTQVR